MPRFGSQGPHGQPPHGPAQTHSTTGNPPPPPSNGPRAMTGTAELRKPEIFDMALNDHMEETSDETARVLAEHKQATVQK